MEDKRGTKCVRSPSKEGSPSLSDAPTPPSAPSGSLPRLGSPPEVSSCRPHSSVFEQGGSSGKAPEVDLSSPSDEKGLSHDTSCAEEFVRRPFNDLNRNILEPPSDDNVIILSNSDAANTEVMPSSAAGIPASTASAVDADEDLKGMQDNNSDDLAPDLEIGDGDSSEDKASSP
jgi:hypothetical protein